MAYMKPAIDVNAKLAPLASSMPGMTQGMSVVATQDPHMAGQVRGPGIPQPGSQVAPGALGRTSMRPPGPGEQQPTGGLIGNQMMRTTP
jgi:hypothetical protein